MALPIPPGVDANGRRNIVFVPTQTLSVATLGTDGVELACYLSKGNFGVTPSTERGTDDRECTTQSAEVLGNTTYAMDALEYVYEPQDDGTSTTNEAYNALTPGTTGYIIERLGVANDTALTAGDKVNVYPVTLGARVPRKADGNNPAEKLKVTQEVAVGQGVLFDQTLVA